MYVLAVIRLERITLVCRELGNPHGSCGSCTWQVRTEGFRLRFSHEGLMAAGHAGRFTSPHLVSYNERITVNDQPISDADLSQLGLVERPAKSGGPPSFLGMVTEFEYGTALAFCISSRWQWMWWCWKRGLGSAGCH